MKSYLSNLAFVGIFSASSIFSSGAFASDGTINISGALTSSSCTVAGSPASGSPGGDIDVDLTELSTTSLKSSGDSAGFKPFTITLSACTPSVVGSVQAGFEIGASTDPASGRLNIDSGTGAATNVQFQLRNSDDTVIKVGDSSTVKGATVVANGATLNYKVGYYATGLPTAGDASSRVTYSIIYP